MTTHVDLTKLLVALAVVAGATVLCALGKLDAAATVATITGVGGYILGNGKAVVSGDRPGTMLTSTAPRTRADDQEPTP